MIGCTNGTTPTDAAAAKDADDDAVVCNQFNVSVMFSDSLEGPWSGESGINVIPLSAPAVFTSPHRPHFLPL